MDSKKEDTIVTYLKRLFNMIKFHVFILIVIGLFINVSASANQMKSYAIDINNDSTVDKIEMIDKKLYFYLNTGDGYDLVTNISDFSSDGGYLLNSISLDSDLLKLNYSFLNSNSQELDVYLSYNGDLNLSKITEIHRFPFDYDNRVDYCTKNINKNLDNKVIYENNILDFSKVECVHEYEIIDSLGDFIKRAKDDTKDKLILVSRYKKLIEVYPLTKENEYMYNNLGYFLYKRGMYKESIYVLDSVINYDNKRVVAFLNIADSYWSDGQKAKANKYYANYLELMKSTGKENKVPKYIYGRLLNEQ